MALILIVIDETADWDDDDWERLHIGLKSYIKQEFVYDEPMRIEIERDNG